jgi:hypothetical protein
MWNTMCAVRHMSLCVVQANNHNFETPSIPWGIVSLALDIITLSSP